MFREVCKIARSSNVHTSLFPHHEKIFANVDKLADVINPVVSLEGGRTAPGDTLQGVTPDLKLIIFVAEFRKTKQNTR